MPGPAATDAGAEMSDYPRDLVGYGREPPHPRWPGDARLCVQFVVNYEEGGESSILHGDFAAECFLSEVPTKPWPGQRHMNIESVYEYGARAGFWRVHRLFTERGFPVTVFGVAGAMRRNPEAVAAMREAGWEIASHGLRWIDYRNVSAEEERAHLSEAVRIHTEVTGERPLGWYTGRTSENTLRLIAEEGGFLYAADSYSDDLPYWGEFNGHPQLVVPYTLDANDMRFATSSGYASGEDFFLYLRDAFDLLYREGETAPKMMSVGLHGRLVGRPGRAAALARFLDHVAGHDRVWVARRLDVARHWVRHHRPASLRPSRMSRALLAELYGDVFEHSPWVAEGAHAAGLTPEADTPQGLHAAMTAVVRAAPRERQLQFLRLHPDLAGRLKVSDMTADSQAEQAGSGLTSLTEAERAHFVDLNDRYKAKFDFPFIVAVRGHTKDSIRALFEQRLENDPETEFEAALGQIETITRLRIEDRMRSEGQGAP